LRAALTVDLEEDAPPFLRSWRGMEEGLPRLLEVLEEEGVRATFFCTAEAAGRFPLWELRGHELGCHGLRHERLDGLSPGEGRRRVREATERMRRRGGRPVGFRAPNFRPTSEVLEEVRRLGYLYDSSLAVYKLYPGLRLPDLPEFPNTLPSSVLRLPLPLSRRILRFCVRKLPLTVLDYHPWEAVRMEGVRWDLRFSTGEASLRKLGALLGELRTEGVEFLTLGEALSSLGREEG
jgi:peptidoglycan/xylan/chitin deacetylase (PgdA/CDA1 family)